MVIAALISFGILLVAWIGAPGDVARRAAPDRDVEVVLFTAEGIARAA
jgi:hypothetical protein